MSNLTLPKLLAFIRSYAEYLNSNNIKNKLLVKSFLLSFKNFILILDSTDSLIVTDKSILQTAFDKALFPIMLDSIKSKSLKSKLAKLLTVEKLKIFNKALGFKIKSLNLDSADRAAERALGLVLLLFGYLVIQYQIHNKTIEHVNSVSLIGLLDVLTTYLVSDSTFYPIEIRASESVLDGLELKALLVQFKDLMSVEKGET